MQHFAERLKAARKMNGFSLQDLSDAMGNKFNKQALQRLESGAIMPDSAIVGLLAKGLGLNADYFFRSATVALEELRFRKQKKLSAREQERVKAGATDFLERYLELEDMLGIDSRISFAPQQYPVQSPEDAEKASLDLRRKWKLGEDPVPNAVEMLEEHNIKVYLLEADKSFSGMSTVLNKTIGLIVLNQNSEIPIVRRRFTALHELAHLYLDLSGYSEKESEKMCDCFAAAMLLPASKAKEMLGKKRSSILIKELYIIAGQYGISLSAIAFRALHLGIISPSTHKYFMIKYNQYRTRNKEFDVFMGREHSERFLQLLIRAVAEEVISSTKAATLNNQKLGDFREILDNAFK